MPRVSESTNYAQERDTPGGQIVGLLPTSKVGFYGATPVAQQTVALLAGSMTGSTDGTIANVAAVTTSGGNTYSDTMLNAVITDLNLQLKELQVKLNALITANQNLGQVKQS